MECDTDYLSDASVATGALPIIQQSTTTRLQILGGSESEDLCAFNALVELTTLLFMMGWCSYLFCVFCVCDFQSSLQNSTTNNCSNLDKLTKVIAKIKL
jgi:hypothetical protein